MMSITAIHIFFLAFGKTQSSHILSHTEKLNNKQHAAPSYHM